MCVPTNLNLSSQYYRFETDSQTKRGGHFWQLLRYVVLTPTTPQSQEKRTRPVIIPVDLARVERAVQVGACRAEKAPGPSHRPREEMTDPHRRDAPSLGPEVRSRCQTETSGFDLAGNR